MSNFVYACVSACFSVHVRGSEYIPLLGSSADPDYSFFGASDFDQWRLWSKRAWVLTGQLPKSIVVSRLLLGSILFSVRFYFSFMSHILESVNFGSTWIMWQDCANMRLLLWSNYWVCHGHQRLYLIAIFYNKICLLDPTIFVRSWKYLAKQICTHDFNVSELNIANNIISFLSRVLYFAQCPVT